MSVLGAFLSTWSNARATFGEGDPQTGDRYDNSGALEKLQSDLASAAPGARWTGTGASAYDTANIEHRRVISELATLDQRLAAQVNQSATVVRTGRASLDAVRKRVVDAAAVPRAEAAERMLVPLVQKGVAEVVDIVIRSNTELTAIGAQVRSIDDEYRALAHQKFGKQGGPQFAGGDKPQNAYEKALREAGLLDGPPPDGYYRQWLKNAERQDVRPSVIVDIARRHDITPESFDVLNGMEEVTDEDGKSFFLMPPTASGEEARKGAVMTYILNCGTDYGEDTAHDFTPTPYSVDEVRRIIDRQNSNSWSYNQNVAFVHANGGRLMTTPNGMLMGLGGSQLQDVFSESGGSTWGDVFMLNIDDPTDAAAQLRRVAESGHMWYSAPDGNGYEGTLDLDRILHHEERHSQQWARYGYPGFIAAYASGAVIDIFGDHPLEKVAGLSDGGYE